MGLIGSPTALPIPPLANILMLHGLQTEPQGATYDLSDQMVVLRSDTPGHGELLDTTQDLTWKMTNDAGCWTQDAHGNRQSDHNHCNPDRGRLPARPSGSTVNLKALALNVFYFMSSVDIEGNLVDANINHDNFNSDVQDLFLASAFTSTRIGGFDAFMAGNQATWVLGLGASTNYGNFQTGAEISRSRGFIRTAKGLNGEAIDYFEISLPKIGEVGSFILNGKSKDAGVTARDVPASSTFCLLNTTVGGAYTVDVQNVCFQGSQCADVESSGPYILDSTAHVIRTDDAFAQSVAQSFVPQAKLEYKADTVFEDMLWKVECGARFNPDYLSVTLDVIWRVAFRIPANQMIITMPGGYCISAVQPVRKGDQYRLGRPFFRNTVLGFSPNNMTVHIEQRALPANLH